MNAINAALIGIAPETERCSERPLACVTACQSGAIGAEHPPHRPGFGQVAARAGWRGLEQQDLAWVAPFVQQEHAESVAVASPSDIRTTMARAART